jgi:hypothetical protein
MAATRNKGFFLNKFSSKLKTHFSKKKKKNSADGSLPLETRE